MPLKIIVMTTMVIALSWVPLSAISLNFPQPNDIVIVNPISQMTKLRLRVDKCWALEPGNLGVMPSSHHYLIRMTLSKSHLSPSSSICASPSMMNLLHRAAVRIQLDGHSVWHLVGIAKMFGINDAHFKQPRKKLSSARL